MAVLARLEVSFPTTRTEPQATMHIPMELNESSADKITSPFLPQRRGVIFARSQFWRTSHAEVGLLPSDAAQAPHDYLRNCVWGRVRKPRAPTKDDGSHGVHAAYQNGCLDGIFRNVLGMIDGLHRGPQPASWW